MNLSPVKKAIVALIVANLIWGAAAPIFKIGLRTVPPFTFAFLRFSIATILLALILGKRIKNPIKNRHDLWMVVAYTLSGITFNISFYFIGLRLTEAINAAVIASAQPIVTLFLAIAFLHERFITRKFIGMLIGTIGICLIVFEPLLSATGGTVTGNHAWSRWRKYHRQNHFQEI
jgi:drug/metabolite transporter (DMT)-like permease